MLLFSCAYKNVCWIILSNFLYIFLEYKKKLMTFNIFSQNIKKVPPRLLFFLKVFVDTTDEILL